MKREHYRNGDEIHVHTGCNSCTPFSVNSVMVHESGCPDEWRDTAKACFQCGCDFYPQERFQSNCEDCMNPEPHSGIETIQLDLPSFFATYLFYGDSSGLRDEEIQEIDSFLEKEGVSHCIDMSENSWFSWRNDMNAVGNDVSTFTFEIAGK